MTTETITFTKSEPIADGAIEYEVRDGAGALIGVLFKDPEMGSDWSSDFNDDTWATLNDAKRDLRRGGTGHRDPVARAAAARAAERGEG